MLLYTVCLKYPKYMIMLFPSSVKVLPRILSPPDVLQRCTSALLVGLVGTPTDYFWRVGYRHWRLFIALNRGTELQL